MKQNTLFTEGNLTKQICIFLIPIILSTFFQHFYVMADAAIVGRYLGDVELAAVGGSATKIISMSINFFVGVSAGVSSYVARYYGAQDMESVKSSIYSGIVMFLVLTTCLSIAAVGLGEHVLIAMNTPADTLTSATVYLNTYLYGLVFCVMYNIIASILRALGDSKSPFYVLIFASALNIGLDLLCMVTFQMGVFGAAFATVVAQGVSAVILLVILYKKMPKSAQKAKLSPAMMVQISRVGLPAGAQSLLFGISNILVQTAINSLGVAAVAAWVAYVKIDSIVEIFVTAAGATALTFVGQNYGAGKMDRVNLCVKRILQIGFALSGGITVLFLLLRNPLLSIFTTDAEIIALGASLMFVIMPMYVISLPYQVLSQALRGMGDTFVPMVISVVGIIGIRVLWVYKIFPAYGTLTSLGYCYPVGAVVLSLSMVAYYRYVQKRMPLAILATESHKKS